MTRFTAPWLAGPLERGRRRVLVVIAGIALTLALLLSLLDGWLANVTFWLAMALWTIIALRVDRSMQGVPRETAGLPDEGELAPRNAGHHRAYRVISALGVLSLLVAILVSEAAERGALGVAPHRALILVLLAYVTVVLNLPWVTLAWHLPDPVPCGDT